MSINDQNNEEICQLGIAVSITGVALLVCVVVILNMLDKQDARLVMIETRIGSMQEAIGR